MAFCGLIPFSGWRGFESKGKPPRRPLSGSNSHGRCSPGISPEDPSKFGGPGTPKKQHLLTWTLKLPVKIGYHPIILGVKPIFKGILRVQDLLTYRGATPALIGYKKKKLLPSFGFPLEPPTQPAHPQAHLHAANRKMGPQGAEFASGAKCHMGLSLVEGATLPGEGKS